MRASYFSYNSLYFSKTALHPPTRHGFSSFPVVSREFFPSLDPLFSQFIYINAASFQTLVSR